MGMKAVCVGLGPSMDLEWINSLDRNEYIVLVCNLWYKFADIRNPDYWLVANNLESMRLKAMAPAINEFRGTYIYRDDLDRTSVSEYINQDVDIHPFGENPSLPELLARDCGMADAPYQAVHSVMVHMVALAMLMGCDVITITGCDLEYGNGYFGNDTNTHKEGYDQGLATQRMGELDMVVDEILALREYGAHIGSRVISKDTGTRLWKALNAEK